MVEKIFSADVAQLDTVTAFLEEELEKADCSPKLTITFSITLEELFVNVAHYAYPDSKGTVKIGIDTTDGVVTIRLIDTGIPFDPLAKPDPDITESAEKREIGGLGIYIVKKSMDSVEYEYRDNQNILTIKKRM